MLAGRGVRPIRRKVLLSLDWFDPASIHDSVGRERAVQFLARQSDPLPAIHAEVDALLSAQRDPSVGLKDFAGL